MARKRLPSTATNKEHEAYEALKEILNEIDKAGTVAESLRKGLDSKAGKADSAAVIIGVAEAQGNALNQIVKIARGAMEELEAD